MNKADRLDPAAVKAAALRLGFDVCGVTAAVASERAAFYQRWTEEGKQGEMAWLARDPERRSDPQKVLPGAQSLIVVGLNYYQPHPERRGRIARYALGQDYHDLMQVKLALLLAELNVLAGGAEMIAKLYVDTGPVLEKPLAQRAGVGWQAKSTMLLNKAFGPWLLLGEIITTAEIEPDAPGRDHCGSCTQCLSACPTGAITAPYQLDARRCIAYLTIEFKGSIPLEFRPLIGDRLYGCDECLEVCPWNRFAQTTREAKFSVGEGTRGKQGTDDLQAILELTQAQFKQRFAGSPILRVKRRGLQRNACVVLGNIGTAEDLPILARVVADHDEPLVREHAAWAILEIKRRLGGDLFDQADRF